MYKIEANKILTKDFLESQIAAGKLAVYASRRVYYSYKHGAKARGYQFNLSFEEFLIISKQNCFYCGKEPSNILAPKCNTGTFTYNGIDRVENTIGYLHSNVVPCCTRCNRGKMVMGKNEFLEWIARVYNHSISKPVNTLINHSFGHIQHQSIL